MIAPRKCAVLEVNLLRCTIHVVRRLLPRWRALLDARDYKALTIGQLAVLAIGIASHAQMSHLVLILLLHAGLRGDGRRLHSLPV